MDRRAVLLERLANYILAEGLSAASLRPLAKAAQTSDRMLLYYFKDKAEVMAATFEVVFARLVILLEQKTSKIRLPLDQLRVAMSGIIFADNLWPYMRLWLEIAGQSARGDPLYRDIGERIARGFLDWGAAQLDSPTAPAHEIDAARLLISIEGMVVLKSVGLDDVIQKAFSVCP
jgi:AcrR family transcriptional regulator